MKYLFIFLASLCLLDLQGQTIVQAEYFIDDDPGFGLGDQLMLTATGTLETTFTVDLSDVDQGYHTLFVRLKDDDDDWSVVNATNFFKNWSGTTAANSEIDTIEYFINDDPGFGMADQVAFNTDSEVVTSFPVDISALDQGMHQLFVRAKDDADNWSVISVRDFFKNWSGSSGANSTIDYLEYFVDADPGFGQGVAIPIVSDTIIETMFQADILNLSMGLHKLFIRARDDANNWSIISVHDFYKSWNGDSSNLFEIVELEYFFDNDPGFGLATQVSVTPSIVLEENFTADIAPLDIGFHQFYCRVKDNKDRWSLVESEAFFKAFDFNGSDADIVKFEYFIDNDPGFGNGVAFNPVSPANVSEATTIVPLTHLAEGDYWFYIRAMDDRGQWSLIASMPFIISHCYDRIKNEDEEFVDCGGVDCIPCTDCSHVDITISDQPIADQTYIRASNDVISDGLVVGSNLVILQADNSILLRQGFEVKETAIFDGIISPCNN